MLFRLELYFATRTRSVIKNNYIKIHASTKPIRPHAIKYETKFPVVS